MATDLTRTFAPGAHARKVARPGRWHWVIIGLSLALVGYIFHDSIQSTAETWLTSPEYNYGPLVPVIAALMLWRDLSRDHPDAWRERSGSWLGVLIVLLGLFLGLVEFLSRTRFPGQLGLFLTVIGIVVTWLGARRSARVWPALVFPLFALPLAGAVQVMLTSALQLASSMGAVAVIRWFDIPVLREGNVIDLGQIKLQVAEACSGLRYLFPLATFGFLCAYLFTGHPVKRAIIFLSSVPITILMNVVRISVTGLLVDRYGVSAAEGFFHDFEGWVVYCLSLVLLFLEMKVLCYIGGGKRSLVLRLDLDPPKLGGAPVWRPQGSAVPGLIAAMLCIGAVAAELAIGARANAVPPRTEFALFPRQIDAWHSVEVPIEQQSLAALNATDHLSLNFMNGGQVVNLWSAYYASQYSGNAAHSPLVCIPGGGWEVENGGIAEIPLRQAAGDTILRANRLIITQGSERHLVYYWFVEGGRPETNEYLAKLRLFANAVIANRRDGALVRFITPIDDADAAQADRTLKDFIAEAAPLLPDYMP